MKKSFIFLADGFEEVEALTSVDVMRRAGMPVVTVSINPGREVVGAHGVTVVADSVFEDNDYSEAEWLVLPGGIPGAPNLADHEALCDLLMAHEENGGKVAAICASPAVVWGMGSASCSIPAALLVLRLYEGRGEKYAAE